MSVSRLLAMAVLAAVMAFSHSVHGEAAAKSGSPEAVLDAFHDALAKGDGEAALALMHENATVLEAGHLETRAVYAAGHLEHDMRFIAQMEQEQLEREVVADEGQVRISTLTRLSGTVSDQALRLVSEETATLVRTKDGWRIAHLYWRSAPEED